jgi:hypothetical protein
MSMAFIVAGMHRSGTSLLASMLNRIGIDMGQHLVPANTANPRGFYEDADFVSFHQKLFQVIHRGLRAGYLDWGWTTHSHTKAIAADDLANFVPDARRLVSQRQALSADHWGFKDPRTTVLLDFWDAVIPDVRYIFSYRAPWLVADSIQRLNLRLFRMNPMYAYRIWEHYNSLLFDFVMRNRERCLLLNIDGLVQDPQRLSTLLGEKLGMPHSGQDYASLIDASLLHANTDDVLGGVTFAAFPKLRSLYAQLDALADVRDPREGRRSWSGYVRPAEAVVSIVIPTYNDAVFLVEALASAERSRSSDSEIIIVNDGTSRPDDIEILNALEGTGFPVIHQPKCGMSAARNVGIKGARGRFILPLDADNRLRFGFIDEARKILELDHTLGVVHGDYELFGESKGRVSVVDFDMRRMLRASYIESCALYRRALWEDVGGYDLNMPVAEDWEFWLHAGIRGWRFHHIDCVSFESRVRQESIFSGSDIWRAMRRVWSHVLVKHQATLQSALPTVVHAAAGLGETENDAAVTRWARYVAGLYWRARWLPRGLVQVFGARVWWRRARRWTKHRLDRVIGSRR